MISKMGNSTVFRSDSEQREGKFQEEWQKEIACGAYTISAYGEDTEEWTEANVKLEEKKRELSRRTELIFWFWRIEGNWAILKKIKSGNHMKNQEDKKSWKSITRNSRRK